MHSFLNGVAAVSLFVSANVYAQQPSPDRLPAPFPSKAIDPLLAKPVDQLTSSEIASMQKKLADWPQLSHYRDENASLPVAGPDRVVFFGDSITDAWAHRDGNSFFPGRPYIDRGIGGQTTPQLLARFQQDVVSLPAISFPWRKGISPGDQIRELNAWMQVYARTHSCVYLDYYTAMADKDGGMRPGLSKDNVHPTPAGYAIMAPLAEKAIALARR